MHSLIQTLLYQRVCSDSETFYGYSNMETGRKKMCILEIDRDIKLKG